MKIKKLEVTGLLGRHDTLEIQFNEDLNILTGRNGSGKTSLLKLIWYIVSGNIVLALKEVAFRRVTLTTTVYQITIHRLGEFTCRIDVVTGGGLTETFSDTYDEEGDIVQNAEDQVNPDLASIGSSVFFPTFRRIEGGFNLAEQRRAAPRTVGGVEESMKALSRQLSNNEHIFVASLSTVDIVNLLSTQYTNLSEQATQYHSKTSQEIISKIKEFKKDESMGPPSIAATSVLDDIRKTIEAMEGKRVDIMKPMEAMKSLAMRLLRHSGIALGKNLSFGDAANAVNSDHLSAGEKQMLSFIAYNAFYKDSIFIIDEPELSLHVDWQRQLFGTLLSQQATNQFIIATHSPFIYSKFPDKEVQIDPERGNEGAE